MRVARHAEINNNREKEREEHNTGRETTPYGYPLILSPWRRLTFVGHPERKGKRKKIKTRQRSRRKLGTYTKLNQKTTRRECSNGDRKQLQQHQPKQRRPNGTEISSNNNRQNEEKKSKKISFLIKRLRTFRVNNLKS